MAEFTERQAEAWPDAIKRAQRYVTSSTISRDPNNYHWTVEYADETRPGRGHSVNATWQDGESLVQITMDVYGYPSMSIAAIEWLHSDGDEECPCGPCAEDTDHG